MQISDENVHLVRCLMDEVFGKRNFCRLITFKKTTGQASDLVASVHDYILWYSKNRSRLKSRPVLRERPSVTLEGSYTWVELPDGRTRRLNARDREDPSSLSDCRHFMTASLVSAGASQEGSRPFEFDGVIYHPAPGTHWKTHRDGLRQLSQRGRLVAVGKTLAYKRYADDYPVVGLDCVWDDTLQSTFAVENIYVVQTTTKVIQRCILMTTDPGDLVFDPTCGSGTTAYVAEQWGRRWITCDTSRVALTLAKQRLMTANFDYYQLAHPHEGVGSGFVYKTVPHITLKSIANNEPPKEETLYDQPKVDRKKTRITGPFTAEAVPAPAVRPLEQLLVDSFQFSEKEVVDAGTKNSKLTTGNYFAAAAARSGETLRQSQWRDELLKAGVRAKGGRKLEFTRIEPMSGTRWIQAEGELKTKNSQLKTFIVFGPEHAPSEQRMMENAWQEARPFKPDILLFCAFQFGDEAAKDIDELKPEIAGMQLLKVQMNADLFTDDLKKKRSGNDSFWLIGQPDVSVDSFQFLVFSKKNRRVL